MIDLTNIKIGECWTSPITNKTYKATETTQICEGCCFRENELCHKSKENLGVDKFSCHRLIYKEVNMTKKDLTNGMVVQLRDESIGLIINEYILFNNSHLCLDDVNDNLTVSFIDHSLDIIKIFKSNNPRDLTEIVNIDTLSLLWEGNKLEEMTIEEIEKKLGMTPGSLRIKK